MRGLTDEEWQDLNWAGDGGHMTVAEKVVRRRLEQRGLIEAVICPGGCPYDDGGPHTHGQVTALGKLALLCDNAARATAQV